MTTETTSTFDHRRMASVQWKKHELHKTTMTPTQKMVKLRPKTYSLWTKSSGGNVLTVDLRLQMAKKGFERCDHEHKKRREREKLELNHRGDSLFFYFLVKGKWKKNRAPCIRIDWMKRITKRKEKNRKYRFCWKQSTSGMDKRDLFLLCICSWVRRHWRNSNEIGAMVCVCESIATIYVRSSILQFHPFFHEREFPLAQKQSKSLHSVANSCVTLCSNWKMKSVTLNSNRIVALVWTLTFVHSMLSFYSFIFRAFETPRQRNQNIYFSYQNMYASFRRNFSLHLARNSSVKLYVLKSVRIVYQFNNFHIENRMHGMRFAFAFHCFFESTEKWKAFCWWYVLHFDDGTTMAINERINDEIDVSGNKAFSMMSF